MNIQDKIRPELIQASTNHEGVLSFLNSSDEFDLHWSANEVEDIPVEKLDKANHFLKELRNFIKEKESCEVLDAGCGDGMHAISLEQDPIAKKADYYGLDISFEALRIAQGRLKNANSEFVHGDVGKLPFKDESFDAVFSFGVLAYTEDPQKSFQELLRVLKPGGLVGVWIYPKTNSLGFKVFNLVRKLCKAVGRNGTNFIANCIVPFLSFLPTSSNLNLSNSTWKQCREIVLVNIAPKYLEFFTRDEIRAWFKNEKVRVSADDDDMPISIWGFKQS